MCVHHLREGVKNNVQVFLYHGATLFPILIKRKSPSEPLCYPLYTGKKISRHQASMYWCDFKLNLVVNVNDWRSYRLTT